MKVTPYSKKRLKQIELLKKYKAAQSKADDARKEYERALYKAGVEQFKRRGY